MPTLKRNSCSGVYDAVRETRKEFLLAAWNWPIQDPKALIRENAGISDGFRASAQGGLFSPFGQQISGHDGPNPCP